MGIDYVNAGIPMARPTIDRESELRRVVLELTAEDFAPYWEQFGSPGINDLKRATVSGRVSEDDERLAIVASHRKYDELINEYWALPHKRDTGYRYNSDGILEIESGGVTAGDDPTESFTVIVKLASVGKILDRLTAWARWDGVDASNYRKRYRRPTNSWFIVKDEGDPGRPFEVTVATAQTETLADGILGFLVSHGDNVSIPRSYYDEDL